MVRRILLLFSIVMLLGSICRGQGNGNVNVVGIGMYDIHRKNLVIGSDGVFSYRILKNVKFTFSSRVNASQISSLSLGGYDESYFGLGDYDLRIKYYMYRSRLRVIGRVVFSRQGRSYYVGFQYRF